MEHLIALLDELKTREMKISQTAKGEMLHQTQRNQLKADLLTAIKQDIAECYEYVFQGADGIMLEIENESVKNGIENELGSGAITACIDIKIKDLEYNAEDMQADYEQVKAEKAEKKKAQAEVKAKKIARDKAERKAKRGE